MNNILIDDKTFAVVATYSGSKIIKEDKVIESELSPNEIISKNCEYYGSSFDGRIIGTKNLINIVYKPPIIVSEYLMIIMFPTSSIREEHCSWININYIQNYFSEKKELVNLLFNDNSQIKLNISIHILEKQIFKASRLKLVFLERKMSKNTF